MTLHSRYFYEIVGQVSGLAIAASIFSVLPIARTLIYYDQRIRLEGFDIEWMMEAAGMNASVRLPAHTPEAETAVAPLEEMRG